MSEESRAAHVDQMRMVSEVLKALDRGDNQWAELLLSSADLKVMCYQFAQAALGIARDFRDFTHRGQQQVDKDRFPQGDVDLSRIYIDALGRFDYLGWIDSFRQAANDLDQGHTDIPDPVRLLVAAAVVTSGGGTLLCRRRDGMPPVAFVAGELEPRESPEQAAEREVREETGLTVRARGIIGRRIHPETGVMMFYVAATLAGPDVVIVNEAELAAAWWASLDEAERLMPDIFPPVREYLRRELLGQ